ncbi:MAG TPA: hypothetical protein VFN39_10135 [Gemmatimonadaceae bacterium]|nr:hypothetical protein [Gemmatimonadaceae bacterium]
MPQALAGLRFPHERILLPRTKLAYVHLRNLLTDAKRERAARVYGYVAIWLPEELVLLYLQEGELVNATTLDASGAMVIPIADALDKVPPEPEYGDICFHEADDEQLACMHYAHVVGEEPWPDELNPLDPHSLFPYLLATTFDGTIEVTLDGNVNYLIVRDGMVERAFLSSVHFGELDEKIEALFRPDGRASRMGVRRFPVPPPVPSQAPPALIHAYRELVNGLVRELITQGKDSAPIIAELARQSLATTHAPLHSFTAMDRLVHDPVAGVEELTDAVAAWVTEVLWAAADMDGGPEAIIRKLTHERRHMFQSAGLFERLPWQM